MKKAAELITKKFESWGQNNNPVGVMREMAKMKILGRTGIEPKTTELVGKDDVAEALNMNSQDFNNNFKQQKQI